MNKRYILSALIVAALAVACDTKSDDPVPTVPETQPTVPVQSDTIPAGPTVDPTVQPSDSIPAGPTVDPTQPDPTQPDPTQPDPTQPDPTVDPTQPDPTVDPTQPDPTDPDPTVIPTPEPPQADAITINPADTTLTQGMHAFTVAFTANGVYYEDEQTIPSWVEFYEGDNNTMSIIVAANPNSETRTAELKFYSDLTEATLKITQKGREGINAPTDGSVNSTISSMTGTDFVLGPIPMQIMGTLKYDITCTTRNYSQGTWTLSKTELCSTMGITEADFDARKGSTIICLPMNKDWTEGENTAAGAYGAWFGSSGTVAWGSSSIAYLEGSDMLSFGYGMHPDNKTSSCVCRLQYQDKLNELAVNVEVTVSLK